MRGEAAISYTDFAQINDMIEDDDEKYANPRNLASGTLNLEDPAEVKARHVRFHAFTLVHLDEPMVSWESGCTFWKNWDLSGRQGSDNRPKTSGSH